MGFLGGKKKRNNGKSGNGQAAAEAISATPATPTTPTASAASTNSSRPLPKTRMNTTTNANTNTNANIDTDANSVLSESNNDIVANDTRSRSSYEYALRRYNETIFPGSNPDFNLNGNTSPTRNATANIIGKEDSNLSKVTPKAQNKSKKKKSSPYSQDEKYVRIVDAPPPPPLPLTKSNERVNKNKSTNDGNGNGNNNVNGDDNGNTIHNRDRVQGNSLSYSHSSSAPSAPSDELLNQRIHRNDSSSTMDDYSDSSSSSSSSSVSFQHGNRSPDANNAYANTMNTNTNTNTNSNNSEKQQVSNSNGQNKPNGHIQRPQQVQRSKTTPVTPTPSFIYSYPNYPGSPVRRHNAPSSSPHPNHRNNKNLHRHMEHEFSNSSINSINSHSPYHLHHESSTATTTLTPTSAMYHSTEPEMVDVTYEEKYGEAYVNKPIRYIYPEGYQHLRPRSRPWQISVILFLAFAWLNIFIVETCSDRYDYTNYYAENDNDGDGNGDDDGGGNNGNNGGYYNNRGYYSDDEYMIATKWCGSRSLYFTWVMSVLITGLSCAYCSIVGYIKARDFSVANNRSQQPGMVGRSDYYVQIEEEINCKGNKRFSNKKVPRSDESFSAAESQSTYSSYQGDSQGKKKSWYKKTLYQADGTPRYFGGRIYRPTQAAVNITSR